MSVPVQSGLTYDDLWAFPHWFVDLDADVVDVYRLGDDGHYGAPTTLGRDEVLTCLAAPGFELTVDRALGD